MVQARDVKGTKASTIIKQRGRVLPKELFVKYELNSGDPWMVAEETIRDLAEKDELVYVGEYRLVKVHKVNLKLQVA